MRKGITNGTWETRYVRGESDNAHVWRLTHNGRHVADVTCMANGCNRDTPAWILKTLSKGGYR